MNTTKRLIEQLEKLTNKKVLLKESIIELDEGNFTFTQFSKMYDTNYAFDCLLENNYIKGISMLGTDIGQVIKKLPSKEEFQSLLELYLKEE